MERFDEQEMLEEDLSLFLDTMKDSQLDNLLLEFGNAIHTWLAKQKSLSSGSEVHEESNIRCITNV